jgi:membrane protein DedA with SNARE-associated domain
MIAASRFIPGTRYPVLLITGMMHLPRWKVLLADGSAAVVTVSLQMFIGWWLAHAVANVGQLMEYHMPIGLGMLAIGVLLVLGYVLVRRRRARRAATT